MVWSWRRPAERRGDWRRRVRSTPSASDVPSGRRPSICERAGGGFVGVQPVPTACLPLTGTATGPPRHDRRVGGPRRRTGPRRRRRSVNDTRRCTCSRRSARRPRLCCERRCLGGGRFGCCRFVARCEVEIGGLRRDRRLVQAVPMHARPVAWRSCRWAGSTAQKHGRPTITFASGYVSGGDKIGPGTS